jgi:glycosyltransferase involved in cell wall biosynthesis
MPAMRVLTLATPATLPQARVLAGSLRRQRPDWPHEVLLIAPRGRECAVEERMNVSSAAEALDLDLEPLIGRHEEQELSALLLPRLLGVYSKRNEGPVLHLPPTAWVLGDLEPVASALAAHSVLLVPRMSADVPDDGLQPSHEQMEVEGRIEQTIMGVDGTSGADGFLTWWAHHIETALGSLDGLEGGERLEDRPWLGRLLELASARFATAVLEHPGCNLNVWNMHAHSLERVAGGAAGEKAADGKAADGEADPTGVLVDGHWQLQFLDLPGFEPDRPHRLSALASRVRVSRSPVLRELCVEYARELQGAGWRETNHRRDVGRHVADGTVYDNTLRLLHERALALGEGFEDVFEPEAWQAFLAWLQGPAPRGAAYGVTRYVFYRVAHERPDVLRAYPDLDGGDGAEYVAWCRAFGREEMGIPDRFMPRQADTPTSAQPALAEEPAGPRVAVEAVHADVADVPPLLAQSAPAVRVTGYLNHTLGLGSAARGYVQALRAAGTPTSTVSVPLFHMQAGTRLQEGYGEHVFEDLVHEGRHGYEVVAVNAEELPDFVARLGDDYFQGPRIGIWGWETNSIPARWKRAFELVSEIWVYSRFMAENFAAVAPVPVIALPPPVQRPEQAANPLRLGVGEGFEFLFAFDYLSTVQRKNPVGLVEAFKRAFAPGEGPRLLIKTINAPLRPLAEEEVLWAAHGRPDIHVVDRSLSAAERDSLMAGCDCYVSLHRSEGFGLTLAEAMAIGKPVIGTGYSGNVDFMTAENSYLVEYEITRVGPDCEIYPADGEWAEPSIEHAAEVMRKVCSDPEGAAAIGARAAQDIARVLSPEATGAAMRRRLDELERAGETFSGGAPQVAAA